MKSITWKTGLAAIALAGFCIPASAGLILTGANGSVAFGAADYGGGPVANSSYIPNNVYGTTDVMTSPGGGFQTANTSNVNNVASFAGGLPGGASWTGGLAASGGTFGSGFVSLNGSNVNFDLTDANPDGSGFASYEIGTWQSTFTNVGAFNGTLGNFLSVGGALPTVASAAAVSLRTEYSVTGGVFGAGPTVVDLPELVLAASGNGNSVAIGGLTGTNAAVVFNGASWEGLAVNNLGNFNLTGGEIFTTTSTLTVIGDPAVGPPYIPLSGTPTYVPPALQPIQASAPDFTFSGTAVPEPSTALFGLAVAFAAMFMRRRSC